MGFTSGFFGGTTLTLALLYTTLYLHRTNRQHQHALLSQQSVLLNSIIEPLAPLPEPPMYETKRMGGFFTGSSSASGEMLKDRWNREVEGLVRGVQETNWRAVREGVEERVKGAWRRVRESGEGK